MSTQRIRLSELAWRFDAVEPATEALRGGALVVFPTETVYGLGTLVSNESAIDRLVRAKGRRTGHALPIAIAGYESLARYVPRVDRVSERLARRCWPGPVTLVLDIPPESPLRQLPPKVQAAILPNGTAGFRVPDHDVFLEILRRLDEPVVLTSANLTGESPAVSADEAKIGLGETPDLLLDDGKAYFQAPSTVIAVQGNRITVLREGAFPKEKIRRLTAKMILFVCTGNTCRSPMAEMIGAKRLAKKLGCELDELESNGYVLMSAGVAAARGSAATGEALAVIQRRGMSLEGHRSQPVTGELLRYADHIYVMSRTHRDALIAEWPDAAPRIDVLAKEGDDIADPLGGNIDVYEACARQIEVEINARMEEIL